MQDYYQLKQQLVVTTLGLSVFVFLGSLVLFSLNIALNYVVGASVGLMYFRLLAREVERLGIQSQRIGFSRIALFIGLIIFATQWQKLHIVPIFLGFVTYKIAILFYTVQTTFRASDPGS